MSDQMGARLAEIIDHGDDIGGPLLLSVAIGIRRLVTQPVAERIHAHHAVSVGQRIDESAALPHTGVHQEAMLQNDQRPLTRDCVMNPMPAMNGKRHCKSPMFWPFADMKWRAAVPVSGTRGRNLSTRSPCFGQTSLAV
jgi:hypothetical protein